MDAISQTQTDIEQSAKFSPCQGPNVDLLDQLERGDALLDQIGTTHLDRMEQTKRMVEYLDDVVTDPDPNLPREIRVVYIPTAMYALRADSKNSPGKQRQRARADGKKRRNQLIRYIQDTYSTSSPSSTLPNLSNVNILATTLDLDDGSIKQSQSTISDEESTVFPKDGREALTSWNPHIIYVEGGNTFWLHHCMTKEGKGGEDWMRLIHDAVHVHANDDGDDSKADSNRRPALYIGKSAGAIVAGKYVETATWKGWDDPSVVPGKETYKDWIYDPNSTSGWNSLGLNAVGGASLFPHMNDDWLDLVEEKRSSLGDGDGPLYCLQEWDACCIEGSQKDVFMS